MGSHNITHLSLVHSLEEVHLPLLAARHFPDFLQVIPLLLGRPLGHRCSQGPGR